MKNIKIEAVMTRSPHSVGIDQPLSVAKKMMSDQSIRHLPVQDGGKLIGIVTERDIRFVEGLPKSFTIEDVYTPEPITVPPNAMLKDVAKRMATDKIGCVLVVDKERLVGIYTSVDACRDLSEAI